MTETTTRTRRPAAARRAVTAVADAPRTVPRQTYPWGAPRTVDQVNETNPNDLAIMTPAQVLLMSAAAFRRRAEIITSPDYGGWPDIIEWTIEEIAAYHGCGRDAVAKWRWQGRRSKPRTRPLMPHKRKRPCEGRGSPSPVWDLYLIMRWSLVYAERTDPRTLTAFPEGRKRPGPPSRSAEPVQFVPFDPEAPFDLDAILQHSPAAAAA